MCVCLKESQVLCEAFLWESRRERTLTQQDGLWYDVSWSGRRGRLAKGQRFIGYRPKTALVHQKNRFPLQTEKYCTHASIVRDQTSFVIISHEEVKEMSVWKVEAFDTKSEKFHTKTDKHELNTMNTSHVKCPVWVWFLHCSCDQ